MFDIGFWELVLIGLLALVVLGPKRLPEAARAAGYWLGRIRNFIANARSELDQHMQAGDMEEIRRLKEELDETRRYIQEVAGNAGAEMASSIQDLESESDNRIGAPEVSEARGRNKQRKKTGNKKAVAKKTAGKKTGKKAASKKAVAKKTAGKAAKKKTSRRKQS